MPLGGLKSGFTSPAYQGARFGVVAIWPRIEATSTGSTATTLKSMWRSQDALLFCFMMDPSQADSLACQFVQHAERLQHRFVPHVGAADVAIAHGGMHAGAVARGRGEMHQAHRLL